MEELTKGGKTVRLNFNGGSQEVRFIKEAFADLIDYIDELEDSDGRLKNITITKLEEAAMWAVKTITS